MKILTTNEPLLGSITGHKNLVFNKQREDMQDIFRGTITLDLVLFFILFFTFSMKKQAPFH